MPEKRFPNLAHARPDSTDCSPVGKAGCFPEDRGIGGCKDCGRSCLGGCSADSDKGAKTAAVQVHGKYLVQVCANCGCPPDPALREPGDGGKWQAGWRRYCWSRARG